MISWRDPLPGNNTLTATDQATSVAIENNPFLAALAFQNGTYSGGSPDFDIWSGLDLTFDFRINEADPDANPVAVWDAALSTAFTLAFADISAVSGLTFTEVDDGSADIDIWSYSANDGTLGYSYGVEGSGVFFNESLHSTPADGFDEGLSYGGYDYLTVIHELLHNLGLEHPFEGYANLPGVTNTYDPGDFSLNQVLYTVMSYSDTNQTDANGDQTTGWPNTNDAIDQSYSVLGAFDIAFLQTLYGANMATATGNTVYEIAAADGDGVYFKSIWDAGGTDEFRYSGSGDVTIDLRAATLDPGDGMRAGGVLSRADGVHGGYTIAKNTIIERATGSSGNDTLTGNDADNRLLGKQGDDTLIGNGGDDNLNGSRGRDVLSGGKQNDTLFGGSGRDRLMGGDQADVILGGSGRDYIVGGKGRDTLTGGKGVDTFVFNKLASFDTITDYLDGTDRFRIMSGASTFDDLTIGLNALDNTSVDISFGSVVITVQNAVVGDFDAGDFLF